MAERRVGKARCGGASAPVQLHYEDLGDLGHPPVLLIMGVGAQLPMWPDGFCARLLDRGYRVIRFDHRDTGLSTKMRGLRAEGSVYPRVLRYLVGRRSPVPYTLVDLADDVRSLGLIMTSSGKPMSSIPKWRVIRLAFGAPGADASAEDRLANEVHNISVINGPNFLPPLEDLRRRVEELTERSHYPQGMLRQFDAILGTGSLMRYTRRIAAPTVVIHGSEDPMVRPRNGLNVARAVAGARYVVVDGMGHDLPELVWRPIVEALTENMTSGL